MTFSSRFHTHFFDKGIHLPIFHMELTYPPERSASIKQHPIDVSAEAPSKAHLMLLLIFTLVIVSE